MITTKTYGKQESFFSQESIAYHAVRTILLVPNGQGGLSEFSNSGWSDFMLGPGPLNSRPEREYYMDKTMPYTTFTSFQTKDSVSAYNKRERSCTIDYTPEITAGHKPRKPVAPVYHLPKRKALKRPTINGQFYNVDDVRRLLLIAPATPKVNFDLGVTRNTRIALRQAIITEKCISQMIWWQAVEEKRIKFKSDYDRRYNIRLADYKTKLAAYDLKLKKWDRRNFSIPKSKRAKKSYNNYHCENPFSDVKVSVPTEGGSCFQSVNYRFGGYSGDGYRLTNLPFGVIQKVETVVDNLTITRYGADMLVLQDFKLQCFSALADHIAELTQKCKLKNTSKLARQEVHLACILAERAQTLNLLTSSIRRLADLISLKKSFFKSAVRYFSKPKLIADDFLAFQFGFKPLLSDIFGAVKLLAETLPSDNYEKIVTRSNSHMEVKALVYLGLEPYEFTGLINVSLVYKYDVESNLARSLESLGLVNPLEIAWEMLPWSFVIDWFLPVQTYIVGLTATTGATLDVGTHATTIVGNFRRIDSSLAPLDTSPHLPHSVEQFLANRTTHHYGGSCGVSAAELFVNIKDRTVVYPNQSADPFQVTLKNPFSWTHNLDALALLTQKLFKHH